MGCDNSIIYDKSNDKSNNKSDDKKVDKNKVTWFYVGLKKPNTVYNIKECEQALSSNQIYKIYNTILYQILTDYGRIYFLKNYILPGIPNYDLYLDCLILKYNHASLELFNTAINQQLDSKYIEHLIKFIDKSSIKSRIQTEVLELEGMPN
jgi:hypothetical protein